MPTLPTSGWRRAGLAVLLAVGVTFALFVPSASAASTVSVAPTTTVNIRTGPGLHYRVTGQLVRGQRIRAQVPMGEVLRYAPDLRALTGGAGVFTMEPSHHEEVPTHLAARIVDEARKAQAEAAR